MNEEVNNIVDRLNAIQKKAFEGCLTFADRKEFKVLARKLPSLGYRTSKRRVCDASGRLIAVTWSAKPISQSCNEGRNAECEFIFTDVRPKDRKTLKGDCTTRAMAYCLNGVMSYDEIESRQYLLAAQKHTRRNTNGTWDIILAEHEYAKLKLGRSVKRSILARILANAITRPVASHSSGHVAVIDRDGVHDTWDSRGGRCLSIYVYKTDLGQVRETLELRGIGSALSTVCLPR